MTAKEALELNEIYKRQSQHSMSSTQMFIEGSSLLKQLVACIDNASLYMTCEYPDLDRKNIEAARDFLQRAKKYKLELMFSGETQCQS